MKRKTGEFGKHVGTHNASKPGAHHIVRTAGGLRARKSLRYGNHERVQRDRARRMRLTLAAYRALFGAG